LLRVISSFGREISSMNKVEGMMSDEGVQRVGMLSLIRSVLEEFGVEPVGLLKSVGLHADRIYAIMRHRL
jgi:hypothetical protein